MKSVLMSIQAKHNRNIESGAKTSELRTAPPPLEPPFRVFTYESGIDGRHEVVNEWICRNVTEWRICMGVPAHLPIAACLSVGEIRAYSGKDYKNITEMEISDLVIYDKPKPLSAFAKPLDRVNCGAKDCGFLDGKGCKWVNAVCAKRVIKTPPQNWGYAEEI